MPTKTEPTKAERRLVEEGRRCRGERQAIRTAEGQKETLATEKPTAPASRKSQARRRAELRIRRIPVKGYRFRGQGQPRALRFTLSRLMSVVVKSIASAVSAPVATAKFVLVGAGSSRACRACASCASDNSGLECSGSGGPQLRGVLSRSGGACVVASERDRGAVSVGAADSRGDADVSDRGAAEDLAAAACARAAARAHLRLSVARRPARCVRGEVCRP